MIKKWKLPKGSYTLSESGAITVDAKFVMQTKEFADMLEFVKRLRERPTLTPSQSKLYRGIGESKAFTAEHLAEGYSKD